MESLRYTSIMHCVHISHCICFTCAIRHLLQIWHTPLVSIMHNCVRQQLLVLAVRPLVRIHPVPLREPGHPQACRLGLGVRMASQMGRATLAD